MARVLLFNKPFGVLSQFTDGNGRPTLAQYIKVPEVYAAGRLDRDSEGLLVLTDDGRLQAKIASPRFRKTKVYYAQVEGIPDARALDALRRGVTLKDGPTRPAEAEAVAEPGWLWPRDPPIRVRKSVTETWLRLSLTEGRNRQVRRMTAHVGHPTCASSGGRWGDWTLEELEPGTWRDAAAVRRDGIHPCPPNRQVRR